MSDGNGATNPEVGDVSQIALVNDYRWVWVPWLERQKEQRIIEMLTGKAGDKEPTL